MTFAASIIDWAALWEVVWISAVLGIGVATVLGVGVIASLKAEDVRDGTAKGSAIGLNAVTVVSVLLVLGAIVAGLLTIFNKS